MSRLADSQLADVRKVRAKMKHRSRNASTHTRASGMWCLITEKKVCHRVENSYKPFLRQYQCSLNLLSCSSSSLLQGANSTNLSDRQAGRQAVRQTFYATSATFIVFLSLYRHDNSGCVGVEYLSNHPIWLRQSRFWWNMKLLYFTKCDD